MTKDKHKKQEHQDGGNNGQTGKVEDGSGGEHQAGRLSPFKNHSQDGSNVPSDYLNSSRD